MVFEDGIRRWDAVFFYVALLVLSDAVWRWRRGMAMQISASLRIFLCGG